MRSAYLLTLLLLAPSAFAAPVGTNATLEIAFDVPGTPTFMASGSAGIVDVSGSTVTVPAGLVGFLAPTPLLIPVTGWTAINSLRLYDLSNLSGTFSIGGVTAQAPGEVCAGGPALGEACNAGGGVGGSVALTGTFTIHIVPMIVVVPINFQLLGFGQGGSTNAPFDVDAAAWSTGTGAVGLSGGVSTSVGAGSPLRLVSPSFVRLLGRELPVFSTLTLTNVSLPVPEPGSAFLIVAGCVGLAVLGVRGR